LIDRWLDGYQFSVYSFQFSDQNIEHIISIRLPLPLSERVI